MHHWAGKRWVNFLFILVGDKDREMSIKGKRQLCGSRNRKSRARDLSIPMGTERESTQVSVWAQYNQFKLARKLMWQRKEQFEKGESKKDRWKGVMNPKLRGVHFIWRATKYKLLFIKRLTWFYISIQQNYHD